MAAAPTTRVTKTTTTTLEVIVYWYTGGQICPLTWMSTGKVIMETCHSHQ